MILQVKQNADGESYIEIPRNMIPVDWPLNNLLEWIDNENGTWTLRRLEEEPT